MVLINGECSDHVTITDRGFQYGDGLFETIEVKSGKPVFLSRHLERLQAGCYRLQIPCPPLDLIRIEAADLCKDSEHAVLKLIVTRGSGGRGYALPQACSPTRVLSLYPYPDHHKDYREQGITARFCLTRLGLNPSLAGIKHLNRLEQVLARSEWKNPEIQEGILLDMNDHVIEGTMTNLFFFKDNEAFTPALTFSGVDGIVRRILMQLLSGQQVPVHEGICTQSQLLSADEVFVCNSIIGLWPVRSIENKRYPIGPMTRQCHAEFDDYKKEAQNNE